MNCYCIVHINNG